MEEENIKKGSQYLQLNLKKRASGSTTLSEMVKLNLGLFSYIVQMYNFSHVWRYVYICAYIYIYIYTWICENSNCVALLSHLGAITSAIQAGNTSIVENNPTE